MSQLTFRVVAALAVTTALLLAGCSGDAPIVLPKPDPTTAPVFATDEDALAAAEVAYGEYLKASDAITAKDGADPNTIGEYVHNEYLPEVLESFEDLRSDNLHSEGKLAFEGMTLQQYTDDLSNSATISVYVCVVATDARLLNENNEDVTPVERDNRVPLEVTFQSEERQPNLLIRSSELWTGADFCESE